MDTCLVKLNGVYKYDVKKSYDLEIHEGDCILISGENGAGKSTLTRLIMGYVNPDRGFIEKRNMKIGYLPEHIEFPLFMKVSKYLDILSRIKKVNAYEDMIYHFKIPIFKSMYELSNGNKQKLGIISACLGEPDLIILDEPLTALDEPGRDEFYEMIKNLKDKGKTMMIISHYPNDLIFLCNKHIKL